MNTKYIIGFVLAIVVVLGGIIFINKLSQGELSNVDLNPFVSCLKEKKATFYGAFWCPHCQATKRLFGTSAKNLPYVECSTPDGNAQTQACRDLGINTYPTWVFADGTRITGERSLQELSSYTGCQLPPELAGESVPVETGGSSNVGTSTATSSSVTATTSATVGR